MQKEFNFEIQCQSCEIQGSHFLILNLTKCCQKSITVCKFELFDKVWCAKKFHSHHLLNYTHELGLSISGSALKQNFESTVRSYILPPLNRVCQDSIKDWRQLLIRLDKLQLKVPPHPSNSSLPRDSKSNQSKTWLRT